MGQSENHSSAIAAGGEAECGFPCKHVGTIGEMHSCGRDHTPENTLCLLLAGAASRSGGQGQPVDCRSFTCIGRVNEGVKARANVLATSLPAFQLRPCVWNCGGWGNIWLPPELLKPGMHWGLSLGATDLTWGQEREYTDVVPPPLQAVV